MDPTTPPDDPTAVLTPPEAGRATMRAAQLVAYGQPLRLRTVERPVPGPRDVRIAVHASSVNPVDWKIAAGSHRMILRYALPWTLGLDVSGVVAEVGDQVTRLRVGDEVFGVLDHNRPGTYAEHVLADESILAHKPARLDHRQAASLPLVALTAWQSLVTAGRLTAGQRVLIQAGAGGVGTVAIQIARHLGAHVTTTCSARNEALVRELGADEVVDYRTHDVEDVVRDQDLVLDSLGSPQRERCLACLKRGGRLVTITTDVPGYVERHGPVLGPIVAMSRIGRFAVSARLRRGVRTSIVVMKPRGEDLAQIASLVDSGALRPIIDSVYPLDRVEDAHEHSRGHHARGKIVIAVDPPTADVDASPLPTDPGSARHG